MHPTEQDATKLASVTTPTESYLVFYLAGQESTATRQFGRWAESPELGLTWQQAVVASNQINKKD